MVQPSLELQCQQGLLEFTGVKGLPKEKTLSLPPTCYTLAEDKSALMKGRKITHALAHLWLQGRNLENEEPRIQSIVKLRDGMETAQDRESRDQDSSLGFATCILWGVGRVPSRPSPK